MTPPAQKQPALRPYLPDDAATVVEIFRASVEELTGDDYSADQQAAWISVADDVDAFNARLAGQLTLIATLDHEPVGFASLKGTDHLDMLYVHPHAVGQGVGSALCDALEKLAALRGATCLTVDASDTAQPFFADRGYSAERRNTVSRNGEWLSNTLMQKRLQPAGQDKQGSVQ